MEVATSAVGNTTTRPFVHLIPAKLWMPGLLLDKKLRKRSSRENLEDKGILKPEHGASEARSLRFNEVAEMLERFLQSRPTPEIIVQRGLIPRKIINEGKAMWQQNNRTKVRCPKDRAKQARHVSLPFRLSQNVQAPPRDPVSSALGSWHHFQSAASRSISQGSSTSCTVSRSPDGRRVVGPLGNYEEKEGLAQGGGRTDADASSHSTSVLGSGGSEAQVAIVAQRLHSQYHKQLRKQYESSQVKEHKKSMLVDLMPKLTPKNKLSGKGQRVKAEGRLNQPKKF
uniref:Uncharacterized protein n=1 Tax=Picocystis salinarum TaxID=88271 RepID=A0A7S3XC89_9CHLO|mmetsp:Transcript_11190/g.69067  ORF Transcript_11190/g.69067 Transcript_11190/m.69067 type:complete len:284 (+) Transcript_11190:125-976(+)